MDRKKAHKNIVAFLSNRTNLKESIEEEIIRKELERTHSPISESYIREYMLTHNSEVNVKVKETLEALAWEMLPENWFISLIKRLDLWGLLLIPPLYPLFSYSAYLFSQENKNWTDIGSCLASITIIVCVLISCFSHLIFSRK